MTWTDPIVKEVREIRDRTAARFDYDVKSIGHYYQERQRKSGHKVVTLPPRRVPAQTDPSSPQSTSD